MTSTRNRSVSLTAKSSVSVSSNIHRGTPWPCRNCSVQRREPGFVSAGDPVGPHTEPTTLSAVTQTRGVARQERCEATPRQMARVIGRSAPVARNRSWPEIPTGQRWLTRRQATHRQTRLRARGVAENWQVSKNFARLAAFCRGDEKITDGRALPPDSAGLVQHSGMNPPNHIRKHAGSGFGDCAHRSAGPVDDLHHAAQLVAVDLPLGQCGGVANLERERQFAAVRRPHASTRIR